MQLPLGISNPHRSVALKTKQNKTKERKRKLARFVTLHATHPNLANKTTKEGPKKKEKKKKKRNNSFQMALMTIPPFA